MSTIAEIRALFPGSGWASQRDVKWTVDRFEVSGEIVTHRPFGKRLLIGVRDATGQIHVEFKRDRIGQAEWNYAKGLKRENNITVTGSPVFSWSLGLVILVDDVVLGAAKEKGS